MANETTRALAADVMRYVATYGEVQGLRHRRAPLDLDAPKKTLSDLRYLEDVSVEEGDDYGSSTRLYNESYVEVTVENVYGELCVKRLHGSMNEIIARVFADAAPEVSFEP